MTQRLTHTIRTWLIIVAIIMSGGPSMAVADCRAFDLQTVLAASAIEPPRLVGFREERHNPLLKEPMVLVGSLEYLERGKLRKQIETPFQESYLVEPGQVSIERGEEVEVIRGQRGQFIASFLGGIESVLAGDVDTLKENFEAQLAGTFSDWTITLLPRSKRLARHMRGLEVKGSGGQVDRITVNLDEEFHVMEIIHDPAPKGQ